MHSPIESQETAIVETKQGNVELELEDVWSDLHSLRKLYGLLHISGNVEERERSENLDEKSRLLLKRLLDGATQQAFQFQAKIITKKPINTSRTPDPPSEKINNPSSSDTKISNSSKATKEEPQNHQQLPPPLPTKNLKEPELMKPKIHHRRTSHGPHKHHRDLHAVRHHPSDGQAYFIIPTVSLKATPAVPGGQGKEVIQVNDGEPSIPKSTAAVQSLDLTIVAPHKQRSTVQIGRAEPPSRRMTCQKRSRRESPGVTSVPPSPYLPVRLLGPNPENMGRQMKHKSPRKPKPVRLTSPPKSPPTPYTPRRTRKAGPTKSSLPRHRVKTVNSLGGSSETSSSDSAPRILPRHQQPIRTRERRPERLSHRVDSGATKSKDQRKDGRLKRIKDKLSVIFHHHHHHHHHLHHHIGDEDHVDGPPDHRKHRSLWKYLRSAVHRKKDYGKLAIEGGAAKDLDRRTVKISPSHGYFHRLLEQLVRHVWRSKGRGVRANAKHVRLGRRRSRLKINKLHWWQRVRRRTNKKKPRLRLGFR